jgi:probable biosynthetic protein (TIGR04099 family)
MSVHMRLADVGSPLSDASSYVLGMPHLNPNGLSENWLWKELGHRHWNLIAKAYGRAATGFGSAGDQPIYAAFRNISLHGGDLGGVRENDSLDVRSTFTHLSETRVVSRHFAACRDRLIADVEMTSVFVRRQARGVNRSITRVRIEGTGSAESSIETMPSQPAYRGHETLAHDTCVDEHELGTTDITMCPHLDFNGAGLLYFSSFVAAVDRAEWHFIGKRSGHFLTRGRQARFHANIEVGDDITVRMFVAQDGAACRHRALLSASVDGKLLAEVVTHRTMR